MKKSVLLVLFSVVLVILSGCSMMPDDEEIINGSILENEIFDDEEFINTEEGEEQDIKENEEIPEEMEIIEVDESVEIDEDGSNEVDIQIVQ